MNNKIIGIAAFLIILALKAPATDRFYDDETAYSPSRRYCLAARSPDNAEEAGLRAFQDDFEYVLSDTQSKTVLWRRRQGQNEGSCGSLYVDDTGWSVIHTGWDQLIPVSPTGKQTATVSLLRDALSEAERERHVVDTTAGPRWLGFSHQFFAVDNTSKLFVIRTWWGKHIVLDLPSGKLVDPTSEQARAISTLERDFVLKTLKAATQDKGLLQEPSMKMFPVFDATYLAGCMRIQDALPFLLELQDAPLVNSSCGGRCDYSEYNKGVSPGSWEEYNARQVIHLALRRLGSAPGPYPATKFRGVSSAATRGRSDRVPKIEKGMTPEEVIGLVGAPDFVEFGGKPLWEYDIDTSTPYTLTLRWGKNGVDRIRKEKPAWRESDRRDRMLVD